MVAILVYTGLCVVDIFETFNMFVFVLYFNKSEKFEFLRFRKVYVKEAKTRDETIKSRVIDPKHVQENFECIRKVHIDIKNIISEEMEEKELRIAEMEAHRAENLMVYEDEIKLKPKRTWFMSERDKKDLKEKTLKKLLKKDNAKEKQPKSKTEKRNNKAQQEKELREREMWATKRMAKGALSQQKMKKEKAQILREKKKRKTRRYERNDGRSSSHRVDALGEKFADRFESIGKKSHKIKKKKKSRHVKGRR